MRKVLVVLLVVLLLVSFVAVLPASAKHDGFEGAQGEKWTNGAEQPGWSHVNTGTGGTGSPGPGGP